MKITTIFPTEIMSWPTYSLSREQVAAINAAIRAEKTHHTPGPWYAESPPSSDSSSRWINARREDTPDILIAKVGVRPDRTSIFEDVANARLIAAAPDLLAALESVIALLHDGGDVQILPADVAQDVRAAISKARGV